MKKIGNSKFGVDMTIVLLSVAPDVGRITMIKIRLSGQLASHSLFSNKLQTPCNCVRGRVMAQDVYILAE